MKTRNLALGAAALGLGGVAVGAGTNVAGIARGVLSSAPAVDDGPDDLLADPTAPRVQRRVTSVDATTLNVEIYGPEPTAADTGDVIVAVHGWTCNTHYWNPQINHFAEKRTVVAYDQRGHGLSELGRRRPTIDTLGQDLDAVLGAVVPPGRRAILIGHSMGGMTIMSWAKQHPEKVSTTVSAVVLASTAAQAVVQNHLLIPEGLPRYSKPFVPAVSRLVTSASTPLPHGPFTSRVSQYVALGSSARASHVEFVDKMIMSCPPRARGRWGAAMGRLDVAAGLDALTVPTTVLVGTDDRLTPRRHADEMSEILRRRGSLRDEIVFDGVGHMSTIEAAGRVNAMLDEIVDEVMAPAVTSRISPSAGHQV
ncbi:alpha/beta hydrolase [Gordonia otitidis]|uniref:alpha/beta fold hydrolase n=1 Tax=Gordonia otitidis TaxID=249058 RepID=UPI001D15B4BA|nr:alpha/beta hydrolase [Gordonia otitidis]UEA60377.1 alpha/beta hydrolase [Gordonia otitidis]